MYRASKKGGKRHIQRDKIGLKATSSPPHGKTVCTVCIQCNEYIAMSMRTEYRVST